MVACVACPMRDLMDDRDPVHHTPGKQPSFGQEPVHGKSYLMTIMRIHGKVGLSISLAVICFACCNSWMYSRLHSTIFMHKTVFQNSLRTSYFQASSLFNPFRRLRSKTVKKMTDSYNAPVNVDSNFGALPNSTLCIPAVCTINQCHSELLGSEPEISAIIVVNNNQDSSDEGIPAMLTETESTVRLKLEPPIYEAEYIETEDEDNEEIVITEDLTQIQSSIDLFCDLYDDISTEERYLQEQREHQLSNDASQSRLFRDNHAGLWTGIYEVFIPTFVTTTFGDEAVSEQLILRKWQSGAVQTTIVAGVAEDYLPEDNAQDVAATEIYTPLFTANPASFEMASSLTCQPSHHQQVSGGKSFTCTSSAMSPSLTDCDKVSIHIPEESEQETKSLNMLQLTGFTTLDVTSELCRATQTAFHPSSLRSLRGNQCVKNALTVSRCAEGACTNGLIMSPLIIEPETYNESTFAVIAEEQQDKNNTEALDEKESKVEERMKNEELLSIHKKEEYEDDEEEEEILIGEDEQVVLMDNKADIKETLIVDASSTSEEISLSSTTFADSLWNPEQEENEDVNITLNDIADTCVSEECVSTSIVPKVYIAELAVREDSLRTRVRFLYAPKRIASGCKSENNEEESKRQDEWEETSVMNPYDLYLVAFVVLREVAVPQLGSDGKIPFISPQELPYDRVQPGKSIDNIPFTAIRTVSASINATFLENGTSSLSNINSTQLMSGDYVEIALPGKLSLLFPRGVKEGENASLTMQWTGEVREFSSFNISSSVEEHSYDAVHAVIRKQYTYQIDRYFSTLQNAAIDTLEVSEVAETIPQTID